MKGNVTAQQLRFILRRQARQDALLRSAIEAHEETKRQRDDKRRKYMAAIALGCILSAFALLKMAASS